MEKKSFLRNVLSNATTAKLVWQKEIYLPNLLILFFLLLADILKLSSIKKDFFQNLIIKMILENYKW